MDGSSTVTLKWKDPSSIPLLPTAPSGYQVSPSSPRLMVNSSGHLVSNGQLQASDAGTYTITSPDFIGTLRVMLIIEGEIHWSLASLMQYEPLLPIQLLACSRLKSGG